MDVITDDFSHRFCKIDMFKSIPKRNVPKKQLSILKKGFSESRKETKTHFTLGKWVNVLLCIFQWPFPTENEHTFQRCTFMTTPEMLYFRSLLQGVFLFFWIANSSYRIYLGTGLFVFSDIMGHIQWVFYISKWLQSRKYKQQNGNNYVFFCSSVLLAL